MKHIWIQGYIPLQPQWTRQVTPEGTWVQTHRHSSCVLRWKPQDKPRKASKGSRRQTRTLCQRLWSIQNSYAYAHVQSCGNQHGFSDENLERSSQDSFYSLHSRQVLEFHGSMIFLVSCALSHRFSFLDKNHRTEIIGWASRKGVP